MLYNKNRVSKANDKKILHKVGKEWKVISVALLMAIAGTGVATSTNVSANSANNNNGNKSVKQVANSDASAEKQLTKPGQFGATSEEQPVNYQQSGASQLTPEQQSLVNSIEGNDQVNSVASNSTSSSANSSVNSSANSSSAVSYLAGDNGSAASYHAKAVSDASVIKNNSGAVQAYVNSLNQKFPQSMNSLENNVKSANAKLNNDNNDAIAYRNVANAKNYNAQVSALASKAGMDVNDFVTYLNAQEGMKSDATSADKGVADEFNKANSLAQEISGINSNPVIKASYQAKREYADDDANVALARLDNAKAQSIAVSNKASQAGIASATLNAKSVKAEIAMINSGVDSMAVKSLAQSLGVPVTETNMNLEDDAKNYNNNETTASVENSQGTTGLINLTDNTKRVLSDMNAMSAYASANAKTNNNASLVSEENSASSAVANASSAYSIASSAARVADILGGTPSLTDIAGSATAHVNYDASKISGNDASEIKDALNILGAQDGITSEPDLDNKVAQLKADLGNINPNIVAPALFDTKAFHLNDIENTLTSIYGNNAQTKLVMNVLNDYNNNADAESKLSNAGKVNNAITDIQSKVNDLTTANIDKGGHFDDTTTNGSNGLKASGNGLGLSNAEINSIDTLLKGVANIYGDNSNSTMTDNEMNNKIIPGAKDFVASMKSAIKSDSSNPDIETISSLGNYDYNKIASTRLGLSSSVFNKYKTVINSALSGLNGDSTPQQAYSAIAKLIFAINHTNASSLTKTTYTYNGLLDSKDADFTKVSNAISPYTDTMSTSMGASNISSLASTATSTYNSAASDSVAFTKANAVPLASMFASSYANDVKADKASVNSANADVDNFFKAEAGNNADKALDALNSAEKAEPMDAAKARAFGLHVYNYGPKYINVIKTSWLHNSVSFSAANHTATAHKGTVLPVLGVGFANDGLIRYVTNINGKVGYVTANPLYTKPAYLFANKHVTVQAARAIGEYKDAAFNHKAKTIDAGTKLSGNVIAMPDSKFNNKRVFGGFARIQLDNGKYITANTDWINIVNSNDANNQPSNGNGNKPSAPQIVNFAD